MPVRPGARLGPYQVLALIGAGGMGEVYKARDTRLDRTVAIKVLPANVATDSERRARFEREARAISALNHSHICTLHDVGDQDGTAFLVMELLEGETLAERLARGALPLNQALRLGAEIADALAYAHRHDIVHRDLKPGNVMLTASGVKLLDFGLAKLRSGFGPLASGSGSATTETLTEEGKLLGTVPYMAPEQIEGKETDARTDIFALGCVLYEIVTGRRAFAGDNSAALMSAILRDDPPPLAKRQPLAPAALDRLVRTCLAKDPRERWQSAADVQRELTCVADELRPTRRRRRRTWHAGARLPRVAVGGRRSWAPWVAGVLGLVLAGSTAAVWVRESRVRWAREVALPEAARLADQARYFPALRLLRRVERLIPDDPLLGQLLRESTCHVTIETDPPGADVVVRDFFDSPDSWEPLGQAPIQDARLPVRAVVFRVSARGFHTTQEIQWTNFAGSTLRFSLRPATDSVPGMVSVPEVPAGPGPNGPAREFWIDQLEVTNRDFKRFVEDGAYLREDSWAEPRLERGVALFLAQAQRTFRDRTGRPGPATWAAGTYPEGEADYPVGGVSWYEAAAYCRWAEKALPTLHHWEAAAMFPSTTELAASGRFAAKGPTTVGAPLSLGRYGTYDMAGNVKEWVWNGTGRDERRYLLGGSWTEPSYMYSFRDAQHPVDRQAHYGFRCARYEEPPAAALFGPVETPERDFRREQPVDDKTFAVLERAYHYDPLPLEASIDASLDQLDYARAEQVSFTAAYGSERVPALLLLPKTGRPPYQAVVYFPAVNTVLEPGPIGLAEREQPWFLFLVRSGRAVVVPVLKGTFERKMRAVLSPVGWRDFLLYARKDVGRTIDYLETRPDFDATRIAFYGLSSGAAAGPIITAVERRFKAGVLLGGGLSSLPFWSEVDVLSFVSRLAVPTLMINGRHDFFFPPETSQKPMFDLIGTADKRHRMFLSGHLPTEWDQVMQEVLDWLDSHLGTVGSGSGG
jgi:hypothetical protein